jgi:nucleoside-diphosphate-sugar epimerase
MPSFLVTGGAGFIGSNIVEALVMRGDKVRVLDNFATGKRENLAPVMDKIELVEGDVRSFHLVRESIEGIDFVLHQAALPSIPRSIKDPITTNEVNVSGTLNVLEAARDAGVERVVYASSSSIYGDSESMSKIENLPPRPLSPYAVSKLAGEKYCYVFHGIYGLKTISLRYFNVFGPRQDPNSQYAAVIPKFLRDMRDGKQPEVYGDGEQSRDFTHVENVVHANLLACEERAAALSGEVFNIACGKRVTINQVVGHINRSLGKNIQPIYTDARAGDLKHSLADIGKASRSLGYAAKTDFEEGLARLAAGRE